MSFAGHAANSSGCVVKPKARATGLIGFVEKIRRYSLIGSSAMEAAEHREPCESRGSCTDLGAPGGEIPPGDSTWLHKNANMRDGDRRNVRPNRRSLRKHFSASPISVGLRKIILAT